MPNACNVAGQVRTLAFAVVLAASVSLSLLTAPAAAQIACSDGNDLNGDCCSSADIQEESRFGFVDAGGGIIIPNGQQCNLNGPNACEDGQDNDGDGLIDSADPECGSVGPGTAFAVIGDDPDAKRFSVRTGAESMIRHARGDGATVDISPISQFWISGVCSAGQCSCGNTADAPNLPHPSCQVQGRTCTVDADCASGGYPGNFSNASICAFDYETYREAVIEGKLVVRGNIDFGRGYLNPRNMLNIGDRLVCAGCGTLKTSVSTPEPWTYWQGDPPWIGAGVCSPSNNLKSCYSDNDCLTPPALAGDRCEGRKPFALSGHPLVDFTGGFEVAQCTAAMAGMAASADPNNPGGLTDAALPGTLAFDPNNPSFNLPAVPPLTSNAIKIASGGTQTLIFDGAGLHVYNIDSITMSSGSTLRLQGRSDAVLVLRVFGAFRMGSENNVLLIPDPNSPSDPGLRVSNVLWLLDGDSGKFQSGRDTVFNGTVLASERDQILMGGTNTVRGSLFAGQVDIKTGTELLHMPFTGSIGTDLSITKDEEPDPTNPSTAIVLAGEVAAGEDIIYTIEVTNNGPSVATGVVVTDVLPEVPGQPGVDGIASVNLMNSSQGTCQFVSIPAAADRVICFLGTMNVTDTVTITLDVTTETFARGILINTATVENSVDENLPSDNTAVAATSSVGVADLTISKSDMPDPAVAGETGSLTYTINVNNLGPSDAFEKNNVGPPGVVVLDAVPPNLMVVSADHTDGGGSGTTPCQVSSNTVTCDLGRIDRDDPDDVITIVVTPACDAHLTNGVGTPLTNSTNLSNIPGEADPVPGNNSASTDSEFVGEVDLRSAKVDSVTAGAGYVIAGTSMNYTVTVTNDGPSTASGVQFVDALPAGTAFSSGAGCNESGTPYVNEVATCNYPSNITCETSSNLQVNVLVNKNVPNGTILTNNITSVTSTGETETAPGNNLSSTNTLVRRESDLAISKSFAPLDGETDCVPGARVEYTLVATNAGPSDATGATVADDFDSNLTCTWVCTATGDASCLTGQPSGTGSAGSGDISQLVDIAAGVGPGHNVTYVAECTIAPSMRGTLSNTGSVTQEAVALADPNPANNAASTMCTLVPRADLSVIKQLTSSPDHVAGVAGDITYTITVFNAGPSDASDGIGVTAEDDVPTGTSVHSITPSQGAACTGTTTQSCNLGTILAGNNATISLALTADCGRRGTIVNTARATTNGEADPNTPNTAMNNSASVVGQVNLSLDKIASIETPGFVVGNQNFTYTINVANTGPSDAQGVVVTDTLDADVTVQGPLPAGCSHPGGAGGTITCTLSDLACNTGTAQRIFTVRATASQAAVIPGDVGEIDNTASVTTSDILGTTSANDGAETDLRLAQGNTCASGINSDCSTNQCVLNGGDNVCCNTACDTLCSACRQSKTGSPDGTCNVVSNDTDPDNECATTAPGTCGQDGFCGGLNDGGSGVDRRGMCGLQNSGASCTGNGLGTGGCSLPDSCNGLGTCLDNNRPEFTACSGNGNDADVCTDNDTCNADGTCNNRDAAPGTPCIDTSVANNGQFDGANECKDAQCNGTGVCDQAFANEGDGTACADGSFCTGQRVGFPGDSCSAGVCVGGATTCDGADGDADCSEMCVDDPSPIDSLGNCNGNDPSGSSCAGNGDDADVCTAADTCNGSGTCLNNDAANGTLCTDSSPPGTNNALQCIRAQCLTGACSQNSGLNVGFHNGTTCYDGSFCDGTNSCGSGTCNDNPGTLPCDGSDGDSDCSEQCVPTGTFPDTGNCNGNDPNGAACNDLNGGTFNDLCNGSGTCAGTPHVTGANTIFVSNEPGSGHTTSLTCGTPTEPCSTIAVGLARAVSGGREGVCIEMSTYNENVTLVSNKNIRGGFNRDGNGNWVPNQGVTDVVGVAAGALTGSSVSGILIDRLRITSANAAGTDANSNPASSYAVRLLSSSSITLTNNVIIAGNGAVGTAGSAGTNGGAAGVGQPGGAGACDSTGTSPGGAGGTSACGRPGGGGGTGGGSTTNGTAGANGTVSGGGGGNGGGGGGWGNPGGDGTNGGNAPTSGTTSNAHGSGGSGGGLVGNLWASNDGGVGAAGTSGHGGGGGGGGGGQNCSVCTSGRGDGGSGGGGGGCLGTGGNGGQGAGGSFGVFMVSSTSITMNSNTITSANGGTGGGGGARGNGSGGAGGGPRRATCTSEVGEGGSGGSGSAGGSGAFGGGGAGGPTITIFCSGGSQSCSGNSRSNGSAGSGGTSGGNAGVIGADLLSSGCGGGC